MAAVLAFLSSFFIFSGWFFSWPNAVATIEARHLQDLISLQHSLDSLDNSEWSIHQRLPNEVYVGPQDGMMKADKIQELPGQPKGVDFDQYSGYVTVDPLAGRALFYYFVESPQDPTTKPLILWLNGGPGCSSLGGGAMVELGPFRVNSDGQTLQTNNYAWNQVANVIFLESPAGVGFSYSNMTSDYELSGDKRTADDAYVFLINWLERFPHYKSRDFFIAGESYAGHYVPELASTILAQNNITNQTVINLKGISMGNALFDRNINTKAKIEYYWTHALISDETYEVIQSKCSFTGTNYTRQCIDALKSANLEIGNIDLYDIYAPLCMESSKAGNLTNVLLDEFDPCLETYARMYLNLPDVQRALHANITGLPYPWIACSESINHNWTDAPVTMLPTIEHLIKSNIRVWIYSGDQDSVIPVTSTRYSINMLGLSIQSSWRPWYTNGEVGGYVVSYKGLMFATIRGAGHMVPIFQPQRALILISSFLKGNSLPYK